MAKFGKINLNTSFSPTVSSPLDARTYFDTMKEAQAAADSAVPVGELGIYHYGMHVLVASGNLNGESYVWYKITKNKTLASIADRIVHRPEEVSSEERMSKILAEASSYDIGTVYKYTGNTCDLYDCGAYYILTSDMLDGDNVRYW